MNTWEAYYQTMIQLFKLRRLLSDNIPNLPPILSWKYHARVAAVAYSCKAFKQLGLGELVGQSKERGTKGGSKVNLLC
jgi:hypothetical protein